MPGLSKAWRAISPVRRRAVAEVPCVLGDLAVRIERARALEGQRLAGSGDEVGPGVGDRPRVDHHLHRVVGGVADRLRCVGDDERHVVGAGLGIDVGRRRPVAGLAVAEVPGVDGDAVVGVARGGAVELDEARGDELVGAGIGDRRLVDPDGKRVALRVRVRGRVVHDHQVDGVGARLRVLVRDRRPRGIGAVAKVPVVGDDLPVAVDRLGRRRS